LKEKSETQGTVIGGALPAAISFILFSFFSPAENSKILFAFITSSDAPPENSWMGHFFLSHRILK
jgi:hypothetical protein